MKSHARVMSHAFLHSTNAFVAVLIHPQRNHMRCVTTGEKTMTHQFNGRGFSQSVEPTFKTPIAGRFEKREFLVNSLMARRYARRSRRENRAL